MCKIIVFILLITTIFCSGLHREQVPTSEDKSQEDSDKYDLESKKDFDRTSEKERELRLLRKAKKLKDNSYRRALESILPAKNNESYRRLFEDLMNNSEEKSKLLKKEAEEVGVPDRRAADSSEDNDSQVEEIEVIIERLSDDFNESDANNASKKSLLTAESKSFNSDSPPGELQEKSISDIPIDLKNDQDQPSQKGNSREDMKERMGLGSLSTLEQLDERSFLESYPITRISEVVIPHYRTTITRSGMIVHPAVYTVQTSTPIVDRVTARSLLLNRRLLPNIYNRLTNNNIGHPNKDMKLIEDYNDYNANAYSYAPSHALARMDKNGEAVSQLTEGSLKSSLGVFNPYGDSLHPSALYSQPQRYLSDGYRPLFMSH